MQRFGPSVAARFQPKGIDFTLLAACFSLPQSPVPLKESLTSLPESPVPLKESLTSPPESLVPLEESLTSLPGSLVPLKGSLTSLQESPVSLKGSLTSLRGNPVPLKGSQAPHPENQTFLPYPCFGPMPFLRSFRISFRMLSMVPRGRSSMRLNRMQHLPQSSLPNSARRESITSVSQT